MADLWQFYKSKKTATKKHLNHCISILQPRQRLHQIAIAKDIIPNDSFEMFKSKKTKCDKKPLSLEQLERVENKVFSSERLSLIKECFLIEKLQCNKLTLPIVITLGSPFKISYE